RPSEARRRRGSPRPIAKAGKPLAGDARCGRDFQGRAGWAAIATRRFVARPSGGADQVATFPGAVGRRATGAARPAPCGLANLPAGFAMKKAIGIIAPLAVVAGLIWLVWFKPPQAEDPEKQPETEVPVHVA